jgi:hypothetical protein
MVHRNVPTPPPLATRRRAGAAYPLLVVTWLLGAVAFAAAAVVTILAGFGTIWPRRIVNTSCFVETDQPSGYVVSRPGGSTTYWHRLLARRGVGRVV